eukprot:135257-Prymnesium_polylepis.1
MDNRWTSGVHLGAAARSAGHARARRHAAALGRGAEPADHGLGRSRPPRVGRPEPLLLGSSRLPAGADAVAAHRGLAGAAGSEQRPAQAAGVLRLRRLHPVHRRRPG